MGEDDDDAGVGFIELGIEAEEIMKREVGSKLELEKGIVRRKKQMMKRSNLIAKQVISMQSALSLGFVSQLWVDINSWIVFLVEVRPSLFSGEGEKFLLEAVKQVGDIVLVEDESVMEMNLSLLDCRHWYALLFLVGFLWGLLIPRVTGRDFSMLLSSVDQERVLGMILKKNGIPMYAILLALPPMVGYNVVTPRQRNIGKVRGYTFNINSGAVESLELDSLGISIIPSPLVVDVLSDTIVVHEAAASRLQRLTKVHWSDGRLVNVRDATVCLLGFWDAQKMAYSADEKQDYSNLRNKPAKPEYNRRCKKSSGKKLRKKMKELADEWDLPMDFF